MRTKFEKLKDYISAWIIHRLGGKTSWEYKMSSYAMPKVSLLRRETRNVESYLEYDKIPDLDIAREIMLEKLYSQLIESMRLAGDVTETTEADVYGEKITLTVEVIK